MIKRTIDIEKNIKQGKVLVIYGARRVGKTTLLKKFLSGTRFKYKLESGDNIRIQEVLSSQNFNLINEFAYGYELIAIDEAQQINNIGMGLKILIDNNPDLIIIATGSSSFDLSQNIGEPLTGRKKTIVLYPIAQIEMKNFMNDFELKEKLGEYLVFGSYPEVINAQSSQEKIEMLEELVNSYLLKDVLSLERIKAPMQIMQLLKLISFQIGNEVSLNELSTQLAMDVKTVQRYLDILEKAFVIKRIGTYSNNLRKEITTKSKYFFYDTGIRNGIISNFNQIKTRNDIGQLFENFVFMERFKKNEYKRHHCNTYFWRTYQQQEIDLVEEYGGKLHAYEIKWMPKKKVKIPEYWEKNYPDSEFKVITNENYLEFVT